MSLGTDSRAEYIVERLRQVKEDEPLYTLRTSAAELIEELIKERDGWKASAYSHAEWMNEKFEH